LWYEPARFVARQVTAAGQPAWPRYDAAKGELMMFTRDVAAILQADPWKSARPD
jgi:hypothetical protein